MQNAGLEWLFRLVQEPRRLFKRYFVTNSVFLYLLSRELVTRTFTKKFEPHEMN
jgi:N-acetylglucosaminyldiphosphoundecaprenol N-acetyl-beta-D-mannosaminyltransferase